MVGMPRKKGNNYDQDAPKNTQIIVARPIGIDTSKRAVNTRFIRL